jgi:hypothetical protein
MIHQIERERQLLQNRGEVGEGKSGERETDDDEE